ncbi:STM3941 family protein [Bernardetia sp.]|uniref:STM3941 family protein n=1 Tax=Bernardetia sp. TaxID=1937974 RepID=UPI0025BE6252|nr:STM3941 family protein [Bernardetia sp.]
MEEIKLYKSPRQGFFLFLVGFIFFVIGVVMISDNNSFEGWMCTIFFGLCALFGLYVILDKKPQVIINETGIWQRTAFWKKHNLDNIIEWSSIKEVYTRSVNSNEFLCLVLTEKIEKKPSLLQKFNKNMGFQDININLGLIRVDEHKLAEFVNQMLYANEEQKKYLLQNFIIPKPKGFLSKIKLW